MRFIQAIFAVALTFAATQAFAHGDKGGPCAQYFESCKTDSSVTSAAKGKARMKAMHACVASAASADATNGPACTAAMAKHKGHGSNSSGAAPATPAAGT